MFLFKKLTIFITLLFILTLTSCNKISDFSEIKKYDETTYLYLHENTRKFLPYKTGMTISQFNKSGEKLNVYRYDSPLFTLPIHYQNYLHKNKVFIFDENFESPITYYDTASRTFYNNSDEMVLHTHFIGENILMFKYEDNNILLYDVTNNKKIPLVEEIEIGTPSSYFYNRTILPY